MNPSELVVAVFVLAGSVGVGIVAHELAHAVTLRTFGISYRIEWFPDRRDDGLLGAILVGKLVAVTPHSISGEKAAGRLRVAAVTPLTLVSPLALVPLGVLPDPFATGDLYLKVAVIGWSACALPSPQDFSVLWHAERALTERATADPDRK